MSNSRNGKRNKSRQLWSINAVENLIERLEAATGPDRELDGLIYGALNNLERNDCTFILDIDGERFQFRHPTKTHPSGPAALYVRGYNVLEYTSSLDAALTLVPDGWWLTLQCKGQHYHADLEYTGPGEVEGPDDVHSYNKPLPALAICIAALKARATTSPR